MSLEEGVESARSDGVGHLLQLLRQPRYLRLAALRVVSTLAHLLVCALHLLLRAPQERFEAAQLCAQLLVLRGHRVRVLGRALLAGLGEALGALGATRLGICARSLAP